MKTNLTPTFHRTFTILALAFAVWGLTGLEPLPAAETAGAQAGEAQRTIEEAGQAATAGASELWRRIDEQRLMNRTPDQIVAWVIMGLLAGGLVRRFSKLPAVAILLVGLAGAFLGGMVANVTQVDLGLGPVLIRYEDLLASLAGAVLLVIAVRWLRSRRSAQP